MASTVGSASPSSLPGLDPLRVGATSATSRRALVLACGVALLGLALVGAVSYRTTSALLAAADGVREAERVRGAGLRLLTALQDIGSGARGFALSGDDSYLPYLQEGSAQAQRWLDELLVAAKGRPRLDATVADLKTFVAERIAVAEELVAMRRRTGSADDPRLLPVLDRARATMDQARRVLTVLDDAESREVAARAEVLARRQRQVVPAIAGLIGVALVLLGGIVWAVRRETDSLHRSEEALLRFLDAAPDASVMIDARGTIVFANAQAERFFGWQRSELLGQQIEILVPESARAGHVGQRERYAASPRPRPMGAGLELNARTRDGREVPVEISLSPIDTPAGTFFTAAVRDITERRQATERLREARAWADSLIETVREPLVVLDGDLRVLRANRAFYRFFATTPGSTVGQELLALGQGAWNVPGLRPALEQLLPRRTALTGFELDQTIPGRGERNLVLHARCVERDESGADTILVAIEDVTERKRSERLIVERRALERVNADLQEFAYAASHDLQEPLRKIRTFGDRILQRWGGTLPDDGRDYLQRMQNAAARMQKLIDDLLAFSRVSTRAQPFEQVDLGGLARDVVQDLEARIEETGGHVELGDLPTIEADPVQMRQLIQNLLANGLKFHRPGQAPTVRVGAQLMNGSGRSPTYELRVEDDGIGFDEKYLDRIFTIFQRLHGRSEYEGTGLGLAICRKIVERHHGRITAHSSPGKGATFVVTLPVSQGEFP